MAYCPVQNQSRVELIPQGSILCPILFLIYINDLPGSLEFLLVRMFADDTTLTASGESVLDAELAINHDNALVLPHFDYCCEVLDTIGLTLCTRLLKLQNKAARIIVGRIKEHGQSELSCSG